MATLSDFAKRKEVEFWTPDFPNHVYRFKGSVLNRRNTADTRYAVGSDIPNISIEFALKNNFEEYQAPMIVKRWVMAYTTPLDPQGCWRTYSTRADAEAGVRKLWIDGYRCSNPLEIQVEIP